MSRYGRHWEDIRGVREQITALVPSVRVDALEAAREDISKHCAWLRALLAQWEALEKEGTDK